jgi:hypothetical protein
MTTTLPAPTKTKLNLATIVNRFNLPVFAFETGPILISGADAQAFYLSKHDGVPLPRGFNADGRPMPQATFIGDGSSELISGRGTAEEKWEIQLEDQDGASGPHFVVIYHGYYWPVRGTGFLDRIILLAAGPTHAEMRTFKGNPKNFGFPAAEGEWEE